MDEAQKKKSKGLKFTIIILIVVMLFFSKEENQKKAIDFIKAAKTTNRTLSLVRSIPMEGGIGDLAFYENGIMVWKDKKLTRFKIDGSKEWEKEFNYDKPMVAFGEDNIYVYEKPTGDIYFLNGSGETIHKAQVNANIMNIVEDFENILVHIKENDMECIDIFNREGNIIENAAIEEGNILTYSMNRDGVTYAISTLNLKGDNLKSEVQIFKISGESLFTTEIDDEIVLYSNFIDKDKLVVMTDKSLYLLDDGNISWEKQIQLIKDIYIDNERINILHGNSLETISIDGKTEEKYAFTEGYNKIIPYDRYMVLYGDEYILGLRNGKEAFKYKGEETILKVVEGKQNLFVIYENRIELLSL